MHKILFVCHGNVGRSPMAEFLLKELVRRAGAEDNYVIASAAASQEALGQDMHPDTKAILEREHIPFSPRTAVQITSNDFYQYDYIVVMDQRNVDDLTAIAPVATKSKIVKLLSWMGLDKDVADPWFTGDFEAAYKDIRPACKAIWQQLSER